MMGIFIITAGSQALFTVFVVMIPISYSIQDTPNTVYTIIQGISVLLLSLVAYKVYKRNNKRNHNSHKNATNFVILAFVFVTTTRMKI